MKVSVIGTGYVGLVSGACLAAKGHDVIGVDLDPGRVRSINRKEPPIHERGLQTLLGEVVGKRFIATTDLAGAVLSTDLSLIAVGSPFNGTEIDLTAIKQAAKQIGEALKHKRDYHVVAVKSTVIPGTTERVVLPILEEASSGTAARTFGLGVNPEFLREGEAIRDFMHPDRIVIGGVDDRVLDALEELYVPFECPDRIRTTIRTAEMIKYASNAFLATLISFSNEIANLCADSGDADVIEVLRGLHLDKRLSPIVGENHARVVPDVIEYLAAGCGFGGSCFPKDVKALIAYGKSIGACTPILEAVIRVNENQPMQVLRLLQKHFASFAGLRIAVLGLAFKPGTSDIRESPAVPIIRALVDQGAHVQAYDPVAIEEARAILPARGVRYCQTLSDAICDSSAVVLITRWKEFQQLPELLAGIEQPPVVVDGRRMLNKQSVPVYEGIGL